LKTIDTMVATTLARTVCNPVLCRTRLNTPMFTSTPAAPTAPNLAISRYSRASFQRSARSPLMVVDRPCLCGIGVPAGFCGGLGDARGVLMAVGASPHANRAVRKYGDPP